VLGFDDPLKPTDPFLALEMYNACCANDLSGERVRRAQLVQSRRACSGQFSKLMRYRWANAQPFEQLTTRNV
jgi:hypothetical protein